MISNKHINRMIAAFMAVLVIFTLIYTYFPDSLPVSTASDTVSMEYASTLFDADSILSVDIQMDEEQWADMLENAVSEAWYACDITINGTTYKNVGIRPKGNTSLSQVASDDTTDRYSFKVKFDYYIDGQTCDGLDCLILNNLISDATYMKEYFSYDMFQFMGVTSSLYSFADISLNEKTWGLYLALEGPEASFLERNYGTSFGQLYKPESSEMEGGGDKENNDRQTFAAEKPERNGENKMSGEKGGFGSSDSNLSYISDDTSDYSYIFDNAVLSPSESDKASVIEALKNINDGTDLETYLDVDQMLRYMAVNVFLVNLDSYFGTMLHNYLLYEENGRLSMLPWDYNLAFSGFQSNSASDSVNLAIDSVVSGASLEDRPLLYQLIQVPEYKEKYHDYLDQLVSEYFESGYFEAKLAKIDALITSYVANDPTAFYTHEEYQTAVNALKTFCSLRSESVRGQLDGTIPSTSEEQSEASGTLVNTDTLNISDMGAQGGGKGGGMDDGGKGGGHAFAQQGGNENGEAVEAGNFSPDTPPDMQENQEKPDFQAGQNSGENQQMPEFSREAVAPPGSSNNSGPTTEFNFSTLLIYSCCFAAAIIGLLFVKFYRRRK